MHHNKKETAVSTFLSFTRLSAHAFCVSAIAAAAAAAAVAGPLRAVVGETKVAPSSPEFSERNVQSSHRRGIGGFNEHSSDSALRPHTSDFTDHTPDLTPHTSFLIHHSSHLTSTPHARRFPPSSHFTPLTSHSHSVHLKHHSSHFRPRISLLISLLTPQTALLSPHILSPTPDTWDLRACTFPMSVTL